MNREEAKKTVKDELEYYLSLKGIDTKKPFICLNPLHNDHKPSMVYHRESKHVKCFSCDAYYDTFDLVGIDYGLTTEKEIFEKAYSLFNLSTDTTEYNRPNLPKEEPLHKGKIEEPVNEYIPDFTQECEEAHIQLLNNNTALEHITKRGISLGIINKYKIGFSPKGYNEMLADYPNHQTKSYKQGLYKYIYPFIDNEGKCNYFISEIEDRNQTDDQNKKYRKINKGTGPQTIAAPLFNERYIKENAPKVVFVCEGIYDALSIEEVGGKAIAFMGTADRRFLRLCEEYKPKTTFVICLDNDQAGKDATERVKKGLRELNISYIVRTFETGKDANEVIMRDKEAFEKNIRGIEEDLTREEEMAKEQEIQEYKKQSASAYLQEFINGVAESVNTPFIPTGFKSFDNILDGGLYEGLYIIGAISSLGKTTIMTQIADQIAEAGTDILLFSLEMARTEIMAKSISRCTLLDVLENNGNLMHAKTTRGITTGKRYKKYCEAEVQLIERATRRYGEYADNIYIHEGIGDIGIEQIRNKVKTHIALTGKRPVVIIDYLQILAPVEIKATDKQNTDKAVLELKRISRDYKIPVIGISSFNRENYKGQVNMTAFKESGAIEYSSDVLIGLQYRGAGNKDFDFKEASNKNPREVELVILKNRNGATGKDINFEYYPLFNYFKEV